MFDKDTIKELSKAEALSVANAESAAAVGTAVLPNDFTLHDLEKFMPMRRRLRGAMTTSVIEHFATYVKDNAEAGARVFIDPASLQATAVLNIGTTAEPGHGDNTAMLKLRQTAAYSALLAVATGMPLTQTKVAEFMEDWAMHVTCENDGGDVPVRKAVGLIRNITIEGLKKLGSQEQQLSATRSTFEQVSATSDEPLPTFIYFNAFPFQGLQARKFAMRLGILTGDKPSIVLRMVNAEEHAEQMAHELAGIVTKQIGDAMPVILGSYSAKA